MGTVIRGAMPLLAAIGCWTAATGTSAQGLATIGGTPVPTMTYASLEQLQQSRTYGSYTGVGTLFVTLQSTATTNLGRLCTGSLVAGNVALTAAHCLYDYNEQGVYDPVRAITFSLPSRGEATAANTFTAASWTVNPGYTGDLAAGNDLSLFTLTAPALNHAIYGLYLAGAEIGSVFTRVGTGTIGGPDGTDTSGLPDYDQRAGVNSFDLYGDQVMPAYSHNLLLSDFDDGTATHNVFGRAGFASTSLFDLGVRNAAGDVIDTDSSPGDSGGPAFINGLIAGVTSFGISGAVVDKSCGNPGNIDPSVTATGQCTNSSIGEIAGDTRVSAYAGFIQSYIAAASVPEPSTWMSAILGLGLAGGLLRRRGRRPARRASPIGA